MVNNATIYQLSFFLLVGYCHEQAAPNIGGFDFGCKSLSLPVAQAGTV